MSVKISTRIPPDEASGLSALADQLEANPFQPVTIVGQMIPARRIADFDSPNDPTTFELRFAAVEPLPAGTDMAIRAEKLLEDAREHRTGVRSLPFDGEDG